MPQINLMGRFRDCGSRIADRGLSRLVAGSLLLAFALPSGCVVRERLAAPTAVSDGTGYVFTYDNISANEVNLAGEFNHWVTKKNDRFEAPFKRREDGVWTITIPYREYVQLPQYDHLTDDIYLEHGRRYQYKIVIDQQNWILDPTNRSTQKNTEDNTENSVLVAP
jgi:1,4-alpha-glucan branching enzyme